MGYRVNSIIALGTCDVNAARERADVAYRAFWQGNGKAVLVATGGPVGRMSKRYQSDVIVEKWERLGVPEERIRVDRRAYDTWSALRYGLGLAEGTHIAFVSNRPHLRRIGWLVTRGQDEGVIDENYSFIGIPSETYVCDYLHELFVFPFTRWQARHGVGKMNASAGMNRIADWAIYFGGRGR